MVIEYVCECGMLIDRSQIALLFLLFFFFFKLPPTLPSPGRVAIISRKSRERLRDDW